MTNTPMPGIRLAASDDPEAWHDDRAGGVTASEIHAIASGGRATWRRILADKLNGSTFTGNAHTRRGHEREEWLLELAAQQYPGIESNRHLYASIDNLRHRATPDGLGVLSNGQLVGAEVKSHAYGWTRTDVPAEHFDQCQWGMVATGAERWLYGWETMGEDGFATLEDPVFLWIERDEKRIAQLVKAADAFLAWRDAGAPEADDLPDDLDDALANWADARDRKATAEADEKNAAKVVRAFIAATPGAADDGIKRTGTRAGFSYTVAHGTELDEAKWQAAEPESYGAWLDLAKRAEAAAAVALALYSKPTKSSRLSFEKSKAAAA
ncbi:YqaJ viral recombinase family protein [Cryobacterium sp. 10S3]|uniref:YqaJ viral recombinase family protein n=1 Tax=Cryobacterium sp. 10S3 TaxID=3048582 RepID=UPI002AC9B704|nr:YqaJ viral recombinase family protein [Cryobacterium sp. 10S3]MEB0286188.1 YqaJ viral recombinase family protein [Cryobacterium sp. 10S3]WPX12246.1 YqaJ viral recombinase family protein [Cryobacterium sp. 10S3]